MDWVSPHIRKLMAEAQEQYRVDISRLLADEKGIPLDQIGDFLAWVALQPPDTWNGLRSDERIDKAAKEWKALHAG